MIRASIIGLAAMLIVSESRAQDHVAGTETSPVMVELFTSQGCPACPAADRVLTELARRPDVLALSFHVTLWDDLGWRDRFGTPANTARQRAYRRPLKNAQVYTPQMVVGGQYEVAAHDVRSASAVITGVTQSRSAAPTLKLSRGDTVTVAVVAANGAPASTVWAAAYLPQIETAVRHGENAGKTMPSSNVVRTFISLGSYSGAAADFSVPADFAREGEGIAVWLQADPSGAILSAANAAPVTR